MSRHTKRDGARADACVLVVLPDIGAMAIGISLGLAALHPSVGEGEPHLLSDEVAPANPGRGGVAVGIAKATKRLCLGQVDHFVQDHQGSGMNVGTAAEVVVIGSALPALGVDLDELHRCVEAAAEGFAVIGQGDIDVNRSEAVVEERLIPHLEPVVNLRLADG